MCSSASSTSARRASAGYVAPVGLFGSMTTSARVAGVIEAADLIDIWLPALRRIGPIEDRAGANLREDRRVERIGRHRDQNLVARPGQRRQRELDAFGRAGRNDDAIGRHRHAALVAFGGDRFARREDPDRRRIAVVPVPHRALDGLDHVRRRPEPEGDRIADIEVADFPAGGFDFPRLGDDVPDGVDEAADAAGDAEWRPRRADIMDSTRCLSGARSADSAAAGVSPTAERDHATIRTWIPARRASVKTPGRQNA